MKETVKKELLELFKKDISKMSDDQIEQMLIQLETLKKLWFSNFDFRKAQWFRDHGLQVPDCFKE